MKNSIYLKYILLAIGCVILLMACSLFSQAGSPTPSEPTQASPASQLTQPIPVVNPTRPPKTKTSQNVESTANPSEAAPANPTQPETGQPTDTATVEPSGVQATEPAANGIATAGPQIQTTAAPTVLPKAAEALPEHPVAGIEMHLIGAKGGLEQVKNSGVAWIRRNALLWSDVEPQEGQRNWQAVAGLDQELQNASQNGLETILIVRSTPVWAQKISGSACGPVKAEKLQVFASFLQDAVARYSASPYNVHYWEIWNEPDIDVSLVALDSAFGCWGDKTDPYYGAGYYTDMLKMIYPKIKGADPQAQVVVGGLVLDCDPVNPPNGKDCTPTRFLEGILKSGGGDFFDGISFHAYDFYGQAVGVYGNPNWHSAYNTTGPVLINKTRYLRSLLNVYGHPEKFLLNTESAVLCGKANGEEPECQANDFTLTKAYYAVQAYAAASAEGLRANIWYSITGWRGSNLIDANLTPLPVLNAITFNAKELKDARFVSAVSGLDRVMGYQFERSGKRLWIVWSLDGQSHTVTLDSMPTAMYDAFGTAKAQVQQLEVTIAPLYIEW